MTRVDPICIFCSNSAKRPCAPEGSFDPSWLALSYLEMIDASEKDKEREEALFWAYNCLDEILDENPEACFDITLLMIDALTSPHQASVVAAGPLEDLIAQNGRQFIQRIEALSVQSRRFHYVLTGVWPQGKDDSEVWNRVSKLQETGPHMDRGDELPASDMKL